MMGAISAVLDNLEDTQKSYQYGRHKGIKLAIEALDYHYRNYMNTCWASSYAWHHETTAYLNRLGQIHYYFRSMGLEPTFNSMPSFWNATKFRMKYSAHRQVDAPRKGDYLADYSAPGITSVKRKRAFQAFEHCRKEDIYPGLTLAIGSNEDFSTTCFYLADEHLYIFAEIVRVITGMPVK